MVAFDKNGQELNVGDSVVYGHNNDRFGPSELIGKIVEITNKRRVEAASLLD